MNQMKPERTNIGGVPGRRGRGSDKGFTIYFKSMSSKDQDGDKFWQNLKKQLAGRHCGLNF